MKSQGDMLVYMDSNTLLLFLNILSAAPAGELRKRYSRKLSLGKAHIEALPQILGTADI